MKYSYITALFTALLLQCVGIACGDEVKLSKAELTKYLSNPRLAKEGQYKYNLRDSAGNQMACVSVIDLADSKFKYAAVYHSNYKAGRGQRFKINLSVSNDLVDWTYVRTLVDTADMPRIRKANGGKWLVMTHEQWMNESRNGASSSPSRIGFKLYYDTSDLLAGKIRSTWNAPSFSQSGLDGTPNFYVYDMKKVDDWWIVEAQIGFHYWNGKRDVNATATVKKLFSPAGGTNWKPVSLDRFNNRLIRLGATGNIGQRDHIAVSSGRYNVHEANIGQATRSWDQWRIWLYEFTEPTVAPNASGTLTTLKPQTHKGSSSFGNPSVSLVRKPSGNGHRIVISYFLFHEAAAPGEAGSLIYFFDLD